MHLQTTTNLYKYPQTPILRVLHTYTPLPVTTTPSGRMFFYSIQVPYLLFDFRYIKILLFLHFPSHFPLQFPYILPLTLTDVVSSPATETCGLSLVSSPHLRADGLLPAATKPAQPRLSKALSKANKKGLYTIPFTLFYLFFVYILKVYFSNNFYNFFNPKFSGK